MSIVVYVLIGLFVLSACLAGYGGYTLSRQIHAQSVTVSDLDARYAAQNRRSRRRSPRRTTTCRRRRRSFAAIRKILLRQQDTINKLVSANDATVAALRQERSTRALGNRRPPRPGPDPGRYDPHRAVIMSSVELRRILAEWRLRMQRVKDILQPAAWTEKEWRQFSQALALLVRDHGRSWIIDPNVYWDLRWKLQDGGELVCQVEHIPEQKTSLVVAQTGGFATDVGSYTWLWAEFNMEGNFARDPYWVDGSWRDALTALLLPLDRQSSYMLAGRTETPEALLLQEGARPNDGDVTLALPDGYAEETSPAAPAPTETNPEPVIAEAVPEPAATTPAEHTGESAPVTIPGRGPGIGGELSRAQQRKWKSSRSRTGCRAPRKRKKHRSTSWLRPRNKRASAACAPRPISPNHCAASRLSFAIVRALCIDHASPPR